MTYTGLYLAWHLYPEAPLEGFEPKQMVQEKPYPSPGQDATAQQVLTPQPAGCVTWDFAPSALSLRPSHV